MTEGMHWIGVFFILIFLIFSYFFGKTISLKMKETKGFNFFKTNSDKKIPLLLEHDIFNTIDRARQKVKYTSFDTKGEYDETKSLMFRDFMNFKLDAIDNNFVFFLKNIPKDISIDALRNDFFEMTQNVVKEYLAKTKEHFLEKDIPIEDVNYVLMLFEKWRLETIESVGHRVTSIFGSDIHSGKFEKLLGSLEAFSIAIDLIPKDGVSAFDEMNGRFRLVKYRK